MILGAIAFAAAWFIGEAWEEADVTRSLKQAFPQADCFKSVRQGCYEARQGDENGELLGRVVLKKVNGYGGPMLVAVGVDQKGAAVGVAIVNQKETPSFLRQVEAGGVLGKLAGKHFADSFQIGKDVDAITGATYTTRALVEAVRDGTREVANLDLGLAAPDPTAPEIRFGILETTIIALYVVWFIGHGRGFRFRKAARWLTFLAGLAVLGFIYNEPLTLAHIDRLILGYWPEWQTNLYLYLLIGGMIFFLAVTNKNPYCAWVCPFGAAQECLGALGDAKVNISRRIRIRLRRAQRIITWSAIMIALLFHNPGISSYEVFGTLFSLTGSSIQFGLLSLVLVLALFIKRPWCNYLCPIRPVEDFLRKVRIWTKESFRKKSPRAVQ